MGETLEWRETPRSKDLVAIVAPTVLPGTVVVKSASDHGITVQLTTTEQQDKIEAWTRNIPDHVLKCSAQDTGTICSSDSYPCFDERYRASGALPEPGQHVRVRLHCKVVRIGNMRKTQLVVTDVLHTGVTA